MCSMIPSSCPAYRLFCVRRRLKIVHKRWIMEKLRYDGGIDRKWQKKWAETGLYHFDVNSP